jgi:Lysozyme like domain
MSWLGYVIAAALAFLVLAGYEEIVRYTPAQIAQFAANAGWTGDDLLTAVAVALAESGGNAKAYNPERGAGTLPGQGSYGLWQIYLHAHPDFTTMDKFDPQLNANEAYKVYVEAGNSFTPWSTYKNGAFEAHLDDAQAGVNA